MDLNRYINRAFQLALRGRGSVSPNPRVGAVIVNPDGTILAEGWHKKFGQAHAEADALTKIPRSVIKGTSLFVTLEPCAHHHHTPPCADAIIEAGIRKVYSVTKDPNPVVDGKGFERLRRAGIEVSLIGDQRMAREINRGFFTWMESGRAWCEAKIALSLDGRMADGKGMSKWISGERSRRLAHKLRADCDAVLVGGGTVATDDPELTVRMIRGPNPVRIILSPEKGIPPDSKLAHTASAVRTIQIRTARTQASSPPGVEEMVVPGNSTGDIYPEDLLKRLPAKGILSVLIEGGAGVLSSFMEADLIDRITIAYSPSVIGWGKSPFEAFLPKSWTGRPFYQIEKIMRLGEDVIVRYDRRSGLSLPD